jgi:hypothetical protein
MATGTRRHLAIMLDDVRLSKDADYYNHVCHLTSGVQRLSLQKMDFLPNDTPCSCASRPREPVTLALESLLDNCMQAPLTRSLRARRVALRVELCAL